MNNDYFPDLVGQHAVKKKLSFYLDAFEKTGMCPFLNLIGAKGLGKTEFAKAFAKNLSNDDDSSVDPTSTRSRDVPPSLAKRVRVSSRDASPNKSRDLSPKPPTGSRGGSFRTAKQVAALSAK